MAGFAPLSLTGSALSLVTAKHNWEAPALGGCNMFSSTAWSARTPSVHRLTLSALTQLSPRAGYLFSSAWFLLTIHNSCFLYTQLAFFFSFAPRLFLMLSFYFPPVSLLCLLWALLWCHSAGPAQLSGPGEMGFTHAGELKNTFKNTG